MTATDDLLKNAESYANSFTKQGLPMPPGKKVAVLACMDARLNVYGVLGLGEGDAHVIRNAGGVVTDDAIRSLTISQRLLGTEDIILIHHTDCGMLTFKDDQVKDQIATDTGIRPHLRSRHSQMPMTTFANRSLESKRVRSSRKRTKSAASSMRWRAAGFDR